MFLYGGSKPPPCLGNADRVCFANRSIPPVSATPTHMLRICVNPRHPLFSGRADNACTNLLGFFVHYVRTRGSMRLQRAEKSPAFALLYHARTRHAWLARLTRARGKSSQREGNALFDDFWYFWSCKSTIKEKLLHVSL